MRKTNLGKLRIVGLLEGVSLITLLGICMPLKYIWDLPEPTEYVGLAHGILFLIYCAFLAVVTLEIKWPFRIAILAFLASIIPFGMILADHHIFKKYQDK